MAAVIFRGQKAKLLPANGLEFKTGQGLDRSGNHDLTLTTTGSTNVTLPTSGTLATTALSIDSRSSAFTAAVGGVIYLCDTSGGAFTATLPSASGNSGQRITFRKTTSDFNALSLGAVAKIHTQGEQVVLVSDGSNWIVLDRHIPKVITTYTPTVSNLGVAGSASGYPRGRWWRDGPNMCIRIAWVSDSVAGSGAAAVTWSIPSGATIDSSRMNSGGFPSSDDYVGTASVFNLVTADQFQGLWGVRPESTTALSVQRSGSAVIAITGGSLPARAVAVAIDIVVPIVDWEG